MIVLTILGILVGAVGSAMLARWVLTSTENPKARTQGLIKGAMLELVGLVIVISTAAGSLMAIGVGVILLLGLPVGFIAARALKPPL